ncbi:hypothetical protein ACFY9C_32195 [Streptomyces filamentosus]|uniref:hypothetical protein n=1 Tax=Streptomyces filamentosus TaxID=67294 RepID=UPI0036E27C25
MRDHREHQEGLGADLAFDAVLDAILAAYQSGLHTAVSAVLDTETGLAEVVTPETTGSFPEAVPIPYGVDGIRAPSGSDGGGHSPLMYVASALQEEVLHLARLASQCDGLQAPPGATIAPSAALESIYIILADIKKALLAQKITKERATLKFRLADTTLQGQITFWAREFERKQSTDAYPMVELFMERRNALRALHGRVVKLFEDVSEGLLQLN